MKLPRIVVTWKAWQLIVRIVARIRRREKPAVPEVDEDPDGNWVEE